jgi:hypothetical protein
MRRQVILLAFLALILSGCGASAAMRYDAALRLWKAQPLAHYLLRTREEVGGHTCGQTVEIRGEVLERVVSNTCAHPNLWTVGWLFRHVQRASESSTSCAFFEPGTGCVCRRATDVQVVYDAVLGIPREITTRETSRPDWQSQAYYRYLLLHGRPPQCAPSATSPGWHILVREIRPLP